MRLANDRLSQIERRNAVLRKAGWHLGKDGLSAQITVWRALNVMLLVLLAAGAMELFYFVATNGVPTSPIVYLAALAILVIGYGAAITFRNPSTITFRDGALHCEQAWPPRRTLIELTEIQAFEGRGSTSEAFVAVLLRDGRTETLPIPVSEAAPGDSKSLAEGIAFALADMLDDARSRTTGYRTGGAASPMLATEPEDDADESRDARRRL